MASPVVWFEVAGTEFEPMKTFYEGLFDWKVQADDNGYGMVDTGIGEGDPGIPGGVFAPGTEAGTWTTFYVGVDDIEASLAQAATLGGSVVQPATPLPTGGTIGLIDDPQGQRVGLIQMG